MEKQRLATSVVEAKNPSSLRVKFDCGLNDNGKTIVKSRTYSNLKHDAKALDIYNVADALASLQQHDVLEIAKIVPTIFESNNFEEMGIKLGEENFCEIKRLAQQTAKLEYQELISKIKKESINDGLFASMNQ